MPVLKAFGGEPSVVNPLLAGPTRRKTDVLDARLLAHHSITGMWPKSFIADAQGLELRVLWAARNEAMVMATRASNRVNNLVLRFGHTIASEMAIRSPEGRAIIGGLVDGDVPNVPCVAPDGLPVGMRPVVGRMMQDLEMYVARAAAALVAAREFVVSRQWPTGEGFIGGAKLLRLLTTVPGVGQTTALTWLSEVLDPRRFQSADQVSAFSGCDPSLKVSAGKVTEYVKRKGNTRLHRALLFAASSVMRSPGERMGAWGASIAGRHRRGGYKKAIGAIGRRIATGLWHVHRLGAEFNISLYRFGRPPAVRDAPVEAIGLGPKATSLLPPGLRTAQSVVNSFWSGQLGAVKGIGQKALQTISDWAKSNRAVYAGPLTYRRDQPKYYEHKTRGRPPSEGRGRGEKKAGGKAG